MKPDPRSMDYLNDPEFQSLLVSCLERLERGETLDGAQLAARHPEFADALRGFLDDHESLQRVASEIRESSVAVPGGGATAPPAAIAQGLDETLGSTPQAEGIAAGERIRYIGEYEILQEIARGGMGIVYKARQQKLNRVVALKMILSGPFADAVDVERFQREAQAAGALNHPRIVAIHEVGEHQGHHYFTMDFVDGRSLAEEIREESLSPKRAAGLLVSLAEAVQFAHDQGTLHRDLKPANVLLDSEGNAKITDFGLAKMIGVAEAEPRSTLTASGQILGTPSYMSPEQATGKLELLGPATDIYSLGAILYACLTGRAPFVAETPVDTLLQVAGNEPVAPRSLNPAIPKDLETICLKCLAKQPHGRYATAQDLADDLTRWLEGRPIRARPSGVVRRSWKWCRRHPARAALIGVLLLGSLTTTLLWRRAERASNLAAEQLYVNQVALAEREWQVHNRDRSMELLLECDPRRQGWEWRFVSRLCFATPHVDLPVTGRTVQVARYDPSGRYLASSDGQRIRVWEADSLALLAESREAVRHFEFSPDGEFIAAAVGNQIRRVPTRRGAEASTLWSGEAPIQRLAFDSTGKQLAALDEALQLVVIQPAESREIFRFRLAERAGRAASWMRFQPGTNRLLVAVAPGPVSVWDAETGNRIEPGPASGDTPKVGNASKVGGAADVRAASEVRGVACSMSENGSRIVYNTSSTGSGARIQVRDTPTGQVFEMVLNEDATAVAISPDGKLLAVAVNELNLGVEDVPGAQNDLAGLLGGMVILATKSRPWRGMVHLYDVERQKRIRTLRGHVGAVFPDGLAFRPDGKQLVSAGGFRIAMDSREHVGELKVWDIQDASPSLVLRGHAAAVTHVVCSNNGRWIASGDKGGFVRVWARSGRLLRAFQMGKGEIRGIAFASRDSQLVTADTSDVVWWDLATGNERYRLGPKQGVAGAEHLPTEDEGKDFLDGDITALSGKGASSLLACVAGGQVRVIDAETQRVVSKFPYKSYESPTTVAFGPDGKQVAFTYYYDMHGELKTFDIGSWRPRIHVETDHVGNPFRTGWGLLDAAFSPDGERIIGVGNNGPGLVWDARRGTRVMELSGHSGFLWAVNYAPDGSRIATGSTDTTVKLWDAATGRELITLRGHDGPVNDLAFSSDGNLLVSGGGDQTVRLWNADLDGLQKQLQGEREGLPGADDRPTWERGPTGSSERTACPTLGRIATTTPGGAGGGKRQERLGLRCGTRGSRKMARRMLSERIRAAVPCLPSVSEHQRIRKPPAIGSETGFRRRRLAGSDRCYWPDSDSRTSRRTSASGCACR